MSFSLNEECGCLISGFDTQPAILMSHARPWAGALLQRAGLVKEIDLHAYRLFPDQLPERVYEIARLARRTPGVSIRHVDMKRFPDEMRCLIDIFNDAWRANWGFVPFRAGRRQCSSCRDASIIARPVWPIRAPTVASQKSPDAMKIVRSQKIQ
jgi:hypothetical protein